jgi:NADH:ubiquinone oxidoreductase subunit H
VSIKGVVQPVLDGIKLLSKEGVTTRIKEWVYFHIAPVGSLFLMLCSWGVIPSILHFTTIPIYAINNYLINFTVLLIRMPICFIFYVKYYVLNIFQATIPILMATLYASMTVYFIYCYYRLYLLTLTLAIVVVGLDVLPIFELYY